MKPPNTPQVLRCAIYTRKSTDEGLEQAFNSLDAQREASLAYVTSQAGEGWIALPALYDDGGYSGGNMERPALARLLADIERGGIDIVVVYKVDRLTRSLADFAKIVERFERRGVSFVSVTQAFNTTSSMGRLTLNVLLSFAQFEREVTSERIRDKIAASKKKGMWMGGVPPLGYVAIDKKLMPHEVEAPIVRRIFERYLEASGVHVLRDELRAEGLISRSWISRHGHTVGGRAFDRGALYHLLGNRLYRGEIRHKTVWYPGQHDAIVPKDLFEAVQAKLAAASKRGRGRPGKSMRPILAGLIWDDRGNRMTTSAVTEGGKTKARYYVSRALLSGRRGEAGSIPRIAAKPIEEVVLDRLGRLMGHSSAATPSAQHGSLGAMVRRVELGRAEIVIRIDRTQLLIARAAAEHGTVPIGFETDHAAVDLQNLLPEGDTLTTEADVIAVTVAAAPVRRGYTKMITAPNGSGAVQRAQHDPALLKAIARAHHWLDQLLAGRAKTLRDLAALEGVKEPYIRKMMPLAFLPPATLRAVLDGRGPVTLTADTVARQGLPLSWKP